MINLDRIKEAEKRLNGKIRKTPLIESILTDKCKVYYKPECLQVTGSFKVRGAYNKIYQLSEEEREKGVICCSSGNHAQGVAAASYALGIKSIICMPKNAPEVKINSTKDYGAEVVLVDGVYDDAYERALELHEKYDYTFVHPFNDEDVIAGQGTIGLEIMKEMPDTDVIICAVGGGGLISGIGLAAKSINPNVKVYGVQSNGAPSMYAALANGYITKLKTAKTIADGIAVKEVGNLTIEYNQKYVDDVFTVSDKQILATIKELAKYEKLIVEGAGAAPVAALLYNHIPNIKEDSKVVCVLSGGNIDISMLENIMEGKIE